MIKDMIESIVQAESRAAELIKDAELKARNLILEYEIKRENDIKSNEQTLKNNVNKIIKEEEAKAEAAFADKIKEGSILSDNIIKNSSQHINEASELIIGRILEKYGSC